MIRRHNVRRHTPFQLGGSLSALLIATASASAQQANPSSSAFGMGGNFTAVARNHEAIAWNAASLGLKETRRFSIGFPGASSDLSSSPVALSDFGGGGALSKATRESWLAAVRTNGTQRGEGAGELSVLSLSVGRVGLQASGVLASRVDLNGDAMEAVLFGNAGLTGQPKTLAFSGSSLRVAALGTVAGSFAIPFGGSSTVEQAIGVTAKYVIGGFTAVAQDGGTSIAPSNINVQFPIIHTNTDNIGSGGSGIGADLSYIRKTASGAIAASVMNVVNSFAWDQGAMVARTGSLRFDGNTNTADFDERAYATAPAPVQQAVDSYAIKPTVSVGIMRLVSSSLTVAADVRQQLGDENSLLIGPRTHAGVGFEFRGIPGLPVRGGFSYVTGGFAISGGASLRLGTVAVGGAVRYRQTNGAGTLGMMVNLPSF